MTQHSLGANVLAVFDIHEDCSDFLSETFDSGTAPAEEARWLFGQSLLGGAEDWDSTMECAAAMQQRSTGLDDQMVGDGPGLLDFLWLMLEPESWHAANAHTWKETDRLIAQARQLEKEAGARPNSSGGIKSRANKSSRLSPRPRRKKASTKSHYWDAEATTLSSASEPISRRLRTSDPGTKHAAPKVDKSPAHEAGHLRPDQENVPPGTQAPELTIHHKHTRLKTSTPRKKSSISPYFSTPSIEVDAKSPRRRPAGTVSSVPFPPLDEPRFGIVQEKLAHEPFWLLIAITFLIKTNGKYAIPVYWKLRERFPTPADLANPENASEILDMIRHLGLSANRLIFFQKYAKTFMKAPPETDTRYRVRNYAPRDFAAEQRNAGAHESPPREEDALDTWEIGHMTQGRYALDSWRIFCRDELLRRAEDWNGKGREPEFQPEWMRVMPSDKELRAYLRWMWMREGWEWDPETGDRRVLRSELQKAVNERRVEYDDTGGLRILDEPRSA